MFKLPKWVFEPLCFFDQGRKVIQPVLFLGCIERFLVNRRFPWWARFKTPMYPHVLVWLLSDRVFYHLVNNTCIGYIVTAWELILWNSKCYMIMVGIQISLMGNEHGFGLAQLHEFTG